MLNRSDMLELTRRMIPARSSIDRVAGCYFDEESYPEGSFNTSFLGLSLADRTKNLKLAKVIPFSETNRQLQEIDFPGETKQSGDMMRLLDGIKESGLKNDALLETFYEMDVPACGFLYPSFKDRSVDWYHIAVYEKEPGVSGRGLKEILI